MSFGDLARSRKQVPTPCHNKVVVREYPVEATSVEGFVQQVVQYITHGYRYFVTGTIPASKDPHTVDAKLLERYSVQATKWTRARRKHQGQANLRYLRHGRFFVILATPGRHPFFEQERSVIKDVREVPIKHAGYSISYRPGGRQRDGSPDPKYRAHVRIETKRYRELKSYFTGLATHRTADKLAAEFWAVPFEPYAPIRRQLHNILRAVNRARQAAGYEKLRYSVLRYKRRIVRPFEPSEERALRMAKAA